MVAEKVKLLKWRHLTTTTLKVITEVERGIKVNNKSRGQGGWLYDLITNVTL